MIKDDQEEFVRDFEVKTNQSFMDLHNVIHDTVQFNGKELSSFYICNQNWKKMKEITLIDMNTGAEEDIGQDEDNPVVKKVTLIMESSRIKDFIDDPHQRIIYEYDFLNPQTFYLELIKVLEADPNISYPVCINRKGELETKPVMVSNLTIEDIQEESLEDYSDYLNEDIEP